MAKRPNKNKLKKLIDDKMKLVEGSPAKFVTAVEKEQAKLLRELSRLIGELDTENGNIKITQKNLDLVADIDKKFKKYFYKSDYIGAVDELITEMDETKSLTKKYFDASFEDINSKQADIIYSSKRVEAAEVLMGATALEAAFFAPVKNAILDAVQNGSSFSELFTSIQTQVSGDEKTDGKLKKYARQIASDTFSTAERNYTTILSSTLDVQFYRYVGGTLPDTRCFCENRNNNYYHIDEIKSWGKGENIGNGCGFPWQGMYKDTNESNIMTWLGGYNCQHSIIPISLILVPISDIQRAIDLGFFKPTEAEKELLGLAD